jgi:hypothetical protein
MRPALPFSLKGLEDFVFYLGGGVLALPCSLIFLRRSTSREEALQWLFLSLTIGVFWLVASLHLRFAPYAELAFLFAFGELLRRTFERADKLSGDLRRGLLRGGTLAIVLAGPLMAAGPLRALNQTSDGTETQAMAEGCDLQAMAAFLNDPEVSADGPATILAFLDHGPDLLYRTPHRVIGTPYHRNGSGIFDSHEMLATSEPALSRNLMRERGVDFVLLCPQAPERAFFSNPNGEASLYRRLENGESLPWLTRLPLPEKLAEQFKLFRAIR